MELGIATPFVGRKDELAALFESCERARTGHMTFVAVMGDAGIGKSRIIREFCNRVVDPAPRIAVGHCLETIRTPFLPFFEVLRSLGLDAGFDLIELEEAAAKDRAQTERHLRRLQSFAHPLLTAASKKPHVLAIEDIHWADAATLGLIEHLAISPPGSQLMLIVTARSEAIERGGAFARMLLRLRRAGMLNIRLDPLAPRAIGELLRSAATAPMPRAAIERIKLLAEGNPLFAEELLHSVAGEHSYPRLRPAHTSIRAAVVDRMYQLSEGDQRVLACAAVMGRTFDVRVVAMLAGRSTQEVLSALRRARNLQLIREGPDGSPQALVFRHAVFSEIIYHEMLEAEAQYLHALVAEYLESLPEGERRDGEIAYHWSKAGNREKVLQYSVRAGDDAMRLTAFEDAARHYDDAISCTAAGSLEWAELVEKRVYALYAAGVSTDTSSLFAEALAAYEGLGLPHKVVEMLLFLSRQAWNDAETPAGYRHARRAAELIGDVDPALRDYAKTMTASYAAHLGRIDEAGRTLGELGADRRPEIRARVADTQAIIDARAGDMQNASRRCLQAQQIARESGDPDVLVRVYSNSADVWASSGRPSQAAELWREAYMAAQAGGYIGRMAYAALGYAGALLEVGEIERANELYNIAIETGVTNASVGIQAVRVGALLRAFIDAPSPVFLDEPGALELALRSKESLRIGQLGGAVAIAHVCQGNLDAARAVLKRSIEALGSASFAESLILVGLLYGDAGTTARSRRLLDALPSVGDPVMAPLCRDAFAALSLSSGPRHSRLLAVAARLGDLSYALLELILTLRSEETARARQLADALGAWACVNRLGGADRKKANRKSILTKRELEVARLLAEHESNRSIAQRLSLSERTVEHHVESILARLDVRSRWLVTADLLARTGAFG